MLNELTEYHLTGKCTKYPFLLHNSVLMTHNIVFRACISTDVNVYCSKINSIQYASVIWLSVINAEYQHDEHSHVFLSVIHWRQLTSTVNTAPSDDQYHDIMILHWLAVNGNKGNYAHFQ